MPPKGRAAKGKAPSKGKGKGKKEPEEESQEAEAAPMEVESPRRTSRRAAAAAKEKEEEEAAAAPAPAVASPARASSRRGAAKKQAQEEEAEEEEEAAPAPPASAESSPRRSGRKRAASVTSSTAEEGEEEETGAAVVESASSPRKGGGRKRKGKQQPEQEQGEEEEKEEGELDADEPPAAAAAPIAAAPTAAAIATAGRAPGGGKKKQGQQQLVPPGGRGGRGGRGGKPGQQQGGRGGGGRGGGGGVTVSDILADRLTALSKQHWPHREDPAQNAFDPAVVASIYEKDIGPDVAAVAAKEDGGEGGGGVQGAARKLQLLEFSSYLEAYLWPFLPTKPEQAEISKAHALSVVLLLGQKLREGVPEPWAGLRGKDGGEEEGDGGRFEALFVRLLELYLATSLVELEGGGDASGALSSPLTEREKVAVLVFLIHCFQSLEEPMVRRVVLRLSSLPLWEALSPGRRTLELEAFPQLKRHWQHHASQKAATTGGSSSPARKKKKGGAAAQEEGSSSGGGGLAALEGTFLPKAIDEFLALVEGQGQAPLPPVRLRFAERFLEFLVDLLGQLPTRRFLKAVLLDRHVGVRLGLCPLPQQSKLAGQLIDSFKFYLAFEINEHTGLPLTDQELATKHFAKVHLLQRLAFKYYRDTLRDLAFASSQVIGDPTKLSAFLARLDEAELKELAGRLKLLDPADAGTEALIAAHGGKPFLLAVLADWHADRVSMIQEINERPLYPSEEVLWDTNVVPTANQSSAATQGAGPSSAIDGSILALPKLNLQFLTFIDYLLRSYTLFRVESAYEVRADLMETIKYLGPKMDPSTGQTLFSGWARMAVPIPQGGLRVTEVRKPNLGERVPAGVKAEIVVDLAQFPGHLRSEWDGLREHDVLFLLTLQGGAESGGATNGGGGKGGRGKGYSSEEEEVRGFCRRFGVRAVRGCEVYEVRDQGGNVLNDPAAAARQQAIKGRPAPSNPVGTRRIYRVHLDPAQYHKDVTKGEGYGGGGGAGVYEGMNVLVRRSAKENNFKAVLETIRGLMNTAAAVVGKAVPPWLHDVFLGYGDPRQAHYRSLALEDQLLTDVDFYDTVLDLKHLKESFPGYKITVQGGEQAASGPYPALKLTFKEESGGSKGEIVAKPYRPPNPGPYPQDQPQRNAVRFTPVQMEAIRAGMNPGLTMVVGPPGTGKTDVAVQIISNLYHAFPGQRILLVTHSNAALNDLFEKTLARDVDPRHLLRLGAGEKELSMEARSKDGYDFTKWGRVNYTLARRLSLLQEVQRLAQTLGVEGDVSYTCETAEYFRLYQVQSRIEAFEAEVAKLQSQQPNPDPAALAAAFPFTDFFATAPGGGVFGKGSFEEDLEAARGCFRHLAKVFEELGDYRAFELLRNQGMRADYLLTKQARVVAMTCTHAALTRQKLVELGFRFDCLVMEEAAQILEVETFIPMLLQETDPAEATSRLKRVVLIGDHHQLPPIIQNLALQKYARLDQSLFARLVRLGVETVQLDKQGRARPAIAQLYAWRYKDLGNLPYVETTAAYRLANAGMAHDFQLVDVQDYQGQGETQPSPFFYQNLGEAEYIAALYVYMRLCGYPAERISVLTTYNGQKALLRDVLRRRCAAHPTLGMPLAIETVDRYQGQQNDYVLLSLVRTRNVGHLRDVRRLVVAMSRARLGLYVFCRQALFENCYELTPAFNRLLAKPPQLELALGERYGEVTRPAGTAPQVGEGLYRVEGGPAHLGVLVQQLLSNLVSHERQQWAAYQAAAAAAAAEEAARAGADEGEEGNGMMEEGDGGEVVGEGEGEGEGPAPTEADEALDA